LQLINKHVDIERKHFKGGTEVSTLVDSSGAALRGREEEIFIYGRGF
jgi:hypothetical protein